MLKEKAQPNSIVPYLPLKDTNDENNEKSHEIEAVSSPQTQLPMEEQKARCRKLVEGPLKIWDTSMNNIQDKRVFFMSPCPTGVKMQCTIRVHQVCCSPFTRFECYLNEHEFMMSAIRCTSSITAKHVISFQQNYKIKDPSSHLGEIRPDFPAKKFEIVGLIEDSPDKSPKSLGFVYYEGSVMFSPQKPRKIEAYVPEIDETTHQVYPFSTRKEESLRKKWQNGDKSHIYKWHNKPPKWNEVYKAHVLDFGNRASKASIANFQLIDEFDDERIFLLLGRVNKDTFHMDFEWPLSPFQAFAMSATALIHRKRSELGDQ